jgi:hypothetical protein
MKPSRAPLLVPAVVFALAAARPAWAEEAVPAWGAALMARLSQLPARSAVFHDEKHIAVLTKPLLSDGVLVYRRPRYLEKRTLTPRPETVIVDGDQITLTTANGGTSTIALASRPELAAFIAAIRDPLTGDLSRLGQHFHIRMEGGMPAWRITLLPAEPGLQSQIRSVAITGADVLITAIDIVSTNGDTETMTIGTAP